MTTGDGIFLGLAMVAWAILIGTLVVCATWNNARKRAGSKDALAPPPGAAQSRRRKL